jgi:predicted lipoprotein
MHVAVETCNTDSNAAVVNVLQMDTGSGLEALQMGPISRTAILSEKAVR